MIIINNLDNCESLVPIAASELAKIKGGNEDINDLNLDNKALASAFAYSDGVDTVSIAETLVEIDPAYSMSQSFALVRVE